MLRTRNSNVGWSAFAMSIVPTRAISAGIGGKFKGQADSLKRRDGGGLEIQLAGRDGFDPEPIEYRGGGASDGELRVRPAARRKSLRRRVPGGTIRRRGSAPAGTGRGVHHRSGSSGRRNTCGWNHFRGASRAAAFHPAAGIWGTGDPPPAGKRSGRAAV